MHARFSSARSMATLMVGLCLAVGACSGGSGQDLEGGNGEEPVADLVPFAATDGDGDVVDFGVNPRFLAFCSDWDVDVPTEAVLMLYGSQDMIDFVTTVVLSGDADQGEIDTSALTSFISIRATLSEVEEGASFALSSANASISDGVGGAEVFLFDADVPPGIRQGEYVSGEGPDSGTVTFGPVDCQEGSEVAVELEARLFSEFSDGGVAMVSGNLPATVIAQPG